jgi:hypothetical protein
MVSLVLGGGAFAFGAVVGWNLYWINRYRTGDIKVTDLVTIIGAIGGAAVLKLFPAGTDLFGWYGLGLAVGFFGYFAVLLLMVRKSGGVFTITWFLDGRKKALNENETLPGPDRRQQPLQAKGGNEPP